MRKGLNTELVKQIAITKEENELKTRYDHKGNVIRDHLQEVRLYAESEYNNVLPELPIAVFDGCKKLSDHMESVNISPVVREVKLAPLSSTPIKKSEVLYNFANKVLNIFSKVDKKLPICNQGRERRKQWLYKDMCQKYATNFFK